MKACAYFRQSSGDDDYSESIEVQRKNCLALAEQKNIEIVGEFQDLNSSGKLYPAGFNELASRDRMYQEWLRDVSSRKTARNGLGELFKYLSEINYIIVDDYTRLARPLTGSFLDSFLTQELFVNNVKILTVKNGEIDPRSFNDSLITALQNRINDNQIAIQRQKSKDGLKKLLDSGINKQGIGRVLGFKSSGKKHEIELVPREVEAVKMIYGCFLDGISLNNIAKLLNKNFSDIFPRGADRQVVRKALLRPFYCGYIYDSNNELIQSCQVKDLAFIPYSAWDQAHQVFEKRKVVAPRPKKHWLPCSGIIFCGNCGEKMICHGSNNRSPFYTCQAHLKIEKEPCRGNLTATNNIPEGMGLTEAIAPLLILGVLQKLKERSQDEGYRKQIQELQVNLNNLVAKEKRITDEWVNGSIEQATWSKSIKNLKAQKKTLSQTITQKQMSYKLLADRDMIKQVFRRVVYNKIKHGEYEELLRVTVKRIEIHISEVVVETFMGRVIIPRRKIGRYNLLPHFNFMGSSFKDLNSSLSLYYYHGSAPIVNIYAKDKVKLAQLGNLKVYYIKSCPESQYSKW